ncbi:MAG: DUF6624 domain-containing protein [Bacteroidota bacterium]
MNIWTTLFLTLFTSCNAFGQTLQQADSLFQLRAYSESAQAYADFFQSLPGDANPESYYQAAVAYSQLGQSDPAIEWLQEAVKRGLDDVYLSQLRFDLHFYPIRHTEAWKTYLNAHLDVFEREAQTISHPDIRQELLVLWETDQYYRQLIFGKYQGRAPRELGTATEAVDRFNAIRLEQIIEEIGWPDHTKVGRDGAHAAWNIIQHAVFNPPLMKKCLNLMKTGWENGKVDGVDYAYLYDRFQAVCYLGPQDYGIVRRVPIRDEHVVEERRKAVGFTQSLKEYLGTYTPITKAEHQQHLRESEEKYRVNREKGSALYEAGQFEEAREHYQLLMSCYEHLTIEDIYRYACLKSRLDTPRSRFQAIRYIRSLSARGYHDIEQLKQEPAFENIRQEKGFQEVLAIIRKYNLPANEQ